VTPVVGGGGGVAGELEHDDEESDDEGAGLEASNEADDGADVVTLGVTGDDTVTMGSGHCWRRRGRGCGRGRDGDRPSPGGGDHSEVDGRCGYCRVTKMPCLNQKSNSSK
jgi:hypothetical protein